jgi:hypothetical protein
VENASLPSESPGCMADSETLSKVTEVARELNKLFDQLIKLA